ncbi:MAG: hypothetical protein EOO88_48960 [Pedobacter sp.]|nr:MAG: hypothetical protein EOO88_48960 [Pedobacter sp.]
MRKIFNLFLAVFAASMSLHAQGRNDTTHVNTFLFDNFSVGTALMKNGGKEVVPLNYNTFDQSIVFKKDNEILTISDPSTVDTVFILDKKFIPLKKGFYEVATGNQATALCISYTMKKRPLVGDVDHAGFSRKSNDVSNNVSNAFIGRALTNGSYSVEFVKHYWVKIFNDVYKANTEKQFIKAVPSHLTQAVSAYFKTHRVNFESEQDVVALVDYCNNQKQ